MTESAFVPLHWAADLVGLPYVPEGCGPQAYDCWGLVREACRRRHGIAMPAAQFDAATQICSTVDAARALGWRRAPRAGYTPADGDIVLMSGLGGRHIGLVLVAQGHTQVLHAHGGIRPDGRPWGQVQIDTAVMLGALGYKELELWTLVR